MSELRLRRRAAGSAHRPRVPARALVRPGDGPLRDARSLRRLRSSDPRTLHRYAYAQDNPLNDYDPTWQQTVAEMEEAESIDAIINNISETITLCAKEQLEGQLFTALAEWATNALIGAALDGSGVANRAVAGAQLRRRRHAGQRGRHAQLARGSALQSRRGEQPAVDRRRPPRVRVQGGLCVAATGKIARRPARRRGPPACRSWSPARASTASTSSSTRSWAWSSSSTTRPPTVTTAIDRPRASAGSARARGCTRWCTTTSSSQRSTSTRRRPSCAGTASAPRAMGMRGTAPKKTAPSFGSIYIAFPVQTSA